MGIKVLSVLLIMEKSPRVPTGAFISYEVLPHVRKFPYCKEILPFGRIKGNENCKEKRRKC